MESLSVTSERFEGKIIQKILQLGIGYERLEIIISSEKKKYYKEDEKEYPETRAAIERMPEMRVRELSFDSYIAFYEINILHPLLERCPRIEKLDVWTCRWSTLRQLSKILKEKKLPRLRHLNVKNTPLSRWYIPDLLSYDEGGLETLEIDAHVGNRIVQSLAQHHHQSLSRLNLYHRYSDVGIGYPTLSGLMTRLPNLQAFEATTLPVYKSEIITIPFDKEWTCVGLRSLRLRISTLYFDGAMSSSEWEGSMQKRYLDYVFSRTAKLKSLQDLGIGCRQRELYLMQSGYLTQLEDLKQLEVFDLASTSPDEFGRNEALWMANNWPRLV